MGHAFRRIDVIWHRACVLARTLMRRVTDPYRPERHYMRGPGPRCRARGAPATDRSPAAPTEHQTSTNECFSL